MDDIAAWATRGLRGNRDSDEDESDAAAAPNDAALGQTIGGPTENSTEAPLTANEMRAQRLQRMEEAAKAAAAQEAPEPMDIDSSASPPPPRAPPRAAVVPVAAVAAPEATKKKRKSEGPADASRKLQRKKELLLRKILQISLAASSTTADSSVTVLDTGSPEISVQSMGEILATRLSLEASDLAAPAAKSVLSYLGQAHRKAAEELKTVMQSKAADGQAEIVALLQEIQRQTVNYAATCLMEPDLFPTAAASVLQLAKSLTNTVTELSASITFGVNGPASSFYYCLVEELQQQDAGALQRLVAELTTHFITQLAKVDNVLDETGVDGGAMVVASALAHMSMHKKAAEALTKMDTFLLPAPGTAAASERVTPPMPAGGNRLLQQFMAGLSPPYLRRSGPGLEKNTLLGLCLRVGIPKNNPAFQPTTILRQSLPAVESATSSQRQQLKIYHETCHQLIGNLIKAGAASRNTVLTWFRDALLVNVGATATRPDPSKVSSPSLLLNVSVSLLRLADPFVQSPTKHALIDPGYVSSESAHGGVFTLTEDLPRLGENVATDDMDTYKPKNGFIPEMAFLTARSLHLGLAALLSQQDSLLRQIGHMHYVISNRGGDLASDPHFGMYVARQRSQEVALYQEDMVERSLQFCNLMAKVMFDMSDDALRTMPEHFVNDICDILTMIAKRKPKLLRVVDFRYIFKVVVKLLSPTYASMVRNYNLRAMLGDTLYEVFLPQNDGARNEVPASVYTDAAAGGQTYMLADSAAQDTLAPSLLLLYGEVEHTGYYDKMSHRAKISSIIKYLWESTEHRPAFRRITQNRDSFIKFANGIMNETNTLIATVMQKLPEIREAQLKMKSSEWGQMTEEQQKQVQERLDDNEREVKHALPLCNKTLKMFSYLNTDEDIRSLFLLDELCSRLVQMLLHVLTKIGGSKGVELKVDNPEALEFKPKIMLQDLCMIFSLFATADTFQVECAKAGCNPSSLRTVLKTVRRLNLLQGERLAAFESLPAVVEKALEKVAQDEAFLVNAPDEFLDEILSSLMRDPVLLPSGHYVDRSTITQHLLNDQTDPFSRKELRLEDIQPATELKTRIEEWVAARRGGREE